MLDKMSKRHSQAVNEIYTKAYYVAHIKDNIKDTQIAEVMERAYQDQAVNDHAFSVLWVCLGGCVVVHSTGEKERAERAGLPVYYLSGGGHGVVSVIREFGINLVTTKSALGVKGYMIPNLHNTRIDLETGEYDYSSKIDKDFYIDVVMNKIKDRDVTRKQLIDLYMEVMDALAEVKA